MRRIATIIVSAFCLWLGTVPLADVHAFGKFTLPRELSRRKPPVRGPRIIPIPPARGEPKDPNILDVRIEGFAVPDPNVIRPALGFCQGFCKVWSGPTYDIVNQKILTVYSASCQGQGGNPCTFHVTQRLEVWNTQFKVWRYAYNDCLTTTLSCQLGSLWGNAFSLNGALFGAKYRLTQVIYTGGTDNDCTVLGNFLGSVQIEFFYNEPV